MMKHHDMI